MKNKIWIGIIIIIIIIILMTIIITYIITYKILSQEDCRLTCVDDTYIPCNTSNDCKFETMSKFCGGDNKVVLRSGFHGYCEKGYCHSYGCGGVPHVE